MSLGTIIYNHFLIAKLYAGLMTSQRVVKIKTGQK